MLLNILQRLSPVRNCPGRDRSSAGTEARQQMLLKQALDREEVPLGRQRLFRASQPGLGGWGRRMQAGQRGWGRRGQMVQAHFPRPGGLGLDLGGVGLQLFSWSHLGILHMPAEVKVLFFRSVRGKFKQHKSESLSHLSPVCPVFPKATTPNVSWVSLLS